MAPSAAQAYRLMPTQPARSYPGPVVRYYNTTSYTSQLTALQRAVNAKKVGITLARTTVRSKADIIVSYAPRSYRFSCNGGRAGLGGAGGLMLARNCSGQEAMFVIAHEMGHSLGLDHENRRCTTMNSIYRMSGSNPVPGKCSAVRRNWFATPYLSDDIAGLKARWVNHAPAARIVWREGAQGFAGEAMILDDLTKDIDANHVFSRLDWGDGSAPITRTLRPGDSWSGWAGAHTYMKAGTYTVTLTARDSYGVSRTTTSTITITGEVVDYCSNMDGVQMQIPPGTYPSNGECLPVP